MAVLSFPDVDTHLVTCSIHALRQQTVHLFHPCTDSSCLKRKSESLVDQNLLFQFVLFFFPLFNKLIFQCSVQITLFIMALSHIYFITLFLCSTLPGTSCLTPAGSLLSPDNPPPHNLHSCPLYSLAFLLKIKSFYLCVCVSVCVTHMNVPEQGVRPQVGRVTDICEPPQVSARGIQALI